jgi:hypothetical protein
MSVLLAGLVVTYYWQITDADWMNDFRLTTHWVQQFIFFAVSLALGQP